MHITEFKLDNDSAYYEAIASFEKGHTPIFKLRCVVSCDIKLYSPIVRDFKTGHMVANAPDCELDDAKLKCIELVKILLKEELEKFSI